MPKVLFLINEEEMQTSSNAWGVAFERVSSVSIFAPPIFSVVRFSHHRNRVVRVRVICCSNGLKSDRLCVSMAYKP